jgi:acyl carrier protein
MDLKDEIVRFVEQTLLRGEGRISPEESLIDRGLLDSIGLMQLMTFLEERTGVRIPDHAITPDNFQTVASMEQLVSGLRARQS